MAWFVTFFYAGYIGAILKTPEKGEYGRIICGILLERLLGPARLYGVSTMAHVFLLWD